MREQNAVVGHLSNSPLCRRSYCSDEGAAGVGEIRRIGNIRDELLQRPRADADAGEPERPGGPGEAMSDPSNQLSGRRSLRAGFEFRSDSFERVRVGRRAIQKALSQRRQPILVAVGHATIFLRNSSARVMGSNGLVMTSRAPCLMNSSISLDWARAVMNTTGMSRVTTSL